MLFPQPFWKGGYLVRKPAHQWVFDVEEGLAEAKNGAGNVTLSAACNSLALLLLKSRRTDDSLALCQAQYTHFLKTAPELAVQPWINIGRIFLRTGRHKDSPRHFFMTDKLAPEDRFHVGGRQLNAPARDALDVCTNVRIVDGVHCVLACDGPPAAAAFLARLRNDNPALVREMEFHCALKARIARALDQLRTHGNVLLLTYLQGLADASAGEASAGMEAVLTLAATLGDHNQRIDYLASILHAIDSILLVLNPGFDIRAAVTALPGIRDSVAVLGDAVLAQRLLPASDVTEQPFPESAETRLLAALDRALTFLN